MTGYAVGCKQTIPKAIPTRRARKVIRKTHTRALAPLLGRRVLCSGGGDGKQGQQGLLGTISFVHSACTCWSWGSKAQPFSTYKYTAKSPPRLHDPAIISSFSPIFCFFFSCFQLGLNGHSLLHIWCPLFTFFALRAAGLSKHDVGAGSRPMAEIGTGSFNFRRSRL
jgi:hypothetical protein